MNADSFIRDLEGLVFVNTFNPYSECCDVYDYIDAPKRRRKLLREMLEAAGRVQIDSIWIGRDLGHRGGRRTGLALTDDVHLRDHADRWGVNVARITKGEAIPERTAAVIWGALSQIPDHVFLWNVFPLHPYEAGKPFSNRAHNSKERAAGEELLAGLIEFLNPQRIVAIGNDAESVVQKIDTDRRVVKVRHPSYGGQNIFLKQIRSMYNINRDMNSPSLF